jgi:hypothetical protein
MYPQSGLFSGVLTFFLVQSTQTLQVNPTQESAYYQQQSVAMLAQISEQVASIVTLISVPSAPQQTPITSTPPPPFPKFYPSASNIRVNVFWLIALVCTLSAAFFAILVQQWIRSYMRVFQRYHHPLKRARFRQFFFEGTSGILKLADTGPRLINISLFLFLFGLGDSILNSNTIVGTTTIVSICIFTSFYLYTLSAHPGKTPYETPISHPIFSLMRKFPRPYFGSRFLRKGRTPTSIEAYQEELVMEETEERKERDVRAIRWLVDNATANAEMEPLVLSIPGTFNTEWGREVWRDVSVERRPDPGALQPQTDRSPAGVPAPLMHHFPRFQEGTAGDTICRCVRYLFETCKNHSYFANDEERHRRLRACVEAAASLVCCIDFQLDWFGEVSKLVSELGRIEDIKESPTTTSDPSFVIRWTCLSLVSVQQTLSSNRMRVLAGYAVTGLARFQSEYGRPDEAGWRSAQKIEDCLKTAWKPVEELRQAFEPWTQKRTREQVEEILLNHELQILELERIKVEAESMEEIDWRISLYQEAMDDATYGLARQLPGVSFDEPRRGESFLISDTFNDVPVTPQLIFPGQQVQALARLGLKLREVLDGQVAEGYKKVLESLKSVDRVPVSLRRPDGLMKRQLWRLQDLRDGGGLGFTVELFFLSLRQLLSIPSVHESNSVFYIGTFKIITSHWEESRDSLGTQQILLDLICNLIIRGRGVFSGFSYPEPITTMLVDMLGNMLRVYTGPDQHIRDTLREIENVDSLICMDTRLQRRALVALTGSRGPEV